MGADQSENLHWFRLSFHLSARDRPEMKLIAHQLSRALANQDVDIVNSGQRFQSRREVHRVADHRRIEPFVRFVGTDVADDRLAVINPNAKSERINSLRAPRLI